MRAALLRFDALPSDDRQGNQKKCDTKRPRPPLPHVADSKTLKILLVEDDLEDEQLLCEALIEIEENRQWCTWRTSSIVHVEQLADALDCLRQDLFDVILLNLSLPDSPVLLDSFLETNACARGAPIVVLADEEDENLANRLLRDGAQDVLLKTELECAPLARSLRYAVERQRRLRALQSSASLDDLTGTLKPDAFFAIARHVAPFAQHTGAELLVSSLEIADLPEQTQDDREARELVLIRAAETLRDEFPSPALIGRLGRCSFGLMTAGLTPATLESMFTRAVAEVERAAEEYERGVTVRVSVARLEPGGSIEEHFAEKTVMLAD